VGGDKTIQVPGMNGPNTAGVTGAESPLLRSPLVFGLFMPGTCTEDVRAVTFWELHFI